MTSVVERLTNFFNEKSDPRTADWFLSQSVAPIITILVTYLYFCKYAGPRYMKDRKPYDLKYIIIVYNFIQVLFSVYLVYEGLNAGWLTSYSFKCQPVDYSNSPEALRMARACWLYYMAKVSELLDTVFFVLRKKYNQVSYLHLYHHTLMPICAYIGVRYLPGGHGTLLGVINSFIHIVMYTYYLLAAFGPEMQKYLWWKKYLTTMQLVQFSIVFTHSLQGMFRECNYPKFIMFLLFIESAYFMYLFGLFYYNSYVKNAKKAAESKQNGTGLSNGIANGKVNEIANGKANGVANGKANGEVNETVNGIANGKVKAQ